MARPKVFIAGHRGMVGAALVRRLEREPVDLVLRDRQALDLCDQAQVMDFFASARPTHVYMAAAKVGGIIANDRFRGQFIHDNLAIQVNLIEAARRHGCAKFLFLGSSCIYPKHAPQPLKEEYLLTGPLEPTNSAYAVAKIAGIEMIDAYRKQYGFNGISVMPTNLYGPGDNWDLQTSHVMPALIRKIHEAKLADAPTVTIWGTGTPKREFLHVDDMADACVHLMHIWDSSEIVNIGCGADIAIGDLARLICRIVGYAGELVFDTSKPDGTPRKLMDTSRLNATGWTPKIALEAGIAAVYADIRANGFPAGRH